MLAHGQAGTEADRYISLSQGADILGVNERTLRRMLASGALIGYRLGRKAIRLRESDVHALLRPIPTADAS
jgi:excisionase family DNA binding protein